MGRLHLVGGEKGGVGRSFVAKLLAQFWIDRATHWQGFDSDASHPSFKRPYDEHVERIDACRATQLDRSVQALEDGVDEVVVDLAGQSQAHLWRWIEDGRVIEFLAQLRHPLLFWFVSDGGRDSVALLEATLARLGGRAPLVCVLNRGRGRRFEAFESAKLRDPIARSGGRVLELPELDADAAAAIDATDKSFWAAVHNDDPALGPCLSLMQRQRTRVFLQDVQTDLHDFLVD